MSNGRGDWHGYYFTAYGIAVKHGFTGTEEEWLESLRGERGAAVRLRYDQDREALEWSHEDREDWALLMDINGLRGQVVSDTLAAAAQARDQAQEARTGAESALAGAQAARKLAQDSAGAAKDHAESAGRSAALAQDAWGRVQDAAREAANAALGSVQAQTAAEAARRAAESAGAEARESAERAGETAEGVFLAKNEAQAAHRGALAAQEAAQTARLLAESAAETAAKDAAELVAPAAAEAAVQAVRDAVRADAERAEAARDGAAAAQDAAESAQGAAEAAREDAENALAGTQAARQGAESAQSAAESARDSAVSAQGAAESAQGVAETARDSAVSAQSSAESAQGAAEAAREDAENALAGAQAARQGAESAQSAAESARDSAVAAQSAAETAQGAAEAARDGAVAAQGAAESAQGAAEAAREDAENALAGAQAARQGAESAQSAAESARDSAVSAQSSAESAQGAAEQSADNAAQSETAARSWAVGGTGTRTGEDQNNAKYWCENARIAAGGGVLTFNARSGDVLSEAGDYSAGQVSYDGSESGLSAETVQAGIDALAASKQDTLTGRPGQVVGFDTSGAASAVQGWSGPNLGINCDFRRPVNRNGRDEYTAAGMTIDRWRLSMSAPGISVRVLPEGISIDKTQADVYGRIAQGLDNPGSLSGATITVSILAKGDTTPYLLLFLNNEASGTGLVNIPLTDEYKLYSITRTLRSGDITRVDAAVGYQTSTPAGSCALLGLKIDMGTRQTLAHQDEAGNWVLNDPPDYALQYALCSLYSPITGAFVGSRYSNDNLLDNWYFADPVNQRGLTSYIGAGYGIDRWISVSAGLTVTVNDGGTITLTNNGDTLAYYRQRLEVHLGPGDYTLSTLVTASDPKSGHNAMYCCYDDDTFSSVVYLDAPGLYAVTSARKAGKYIFRAQYNIAPGGSLTLCAAKLEPGLVQTLGHRDEAGNWVLSDSPPNKVLELAKCQRCFVRLPLLPYQSIGIAQGFTGTRARLSLYLPQPMRATPSLNAPPGDIFQLVESPASEATSPSAHLSTSATSLSNNILTLELNPQDGVSLSVGQTYIVRNKETSAYIDISSDL